MDLFKAISEAMVAQKRTRYREIGAPDLLSSSYARNFFTSPDPDLLGRGILDVSCLYLDDRMITAHWGMIFRNRFYYYMPSFERGPWMRSSPGEILLAELLKRAIDRGIEIFDLTIGDESYKKRWCDLELELKQYFEPRSARGKAAKIAYDLYRIVIATPLLLKAARKAKRVIWRVKHCVGGRS
jgi:CelD/BcsL family acetyltransferase involved in cellulose biosynthesis